jgi:rSAM/selenodomain-associated transferase 1
MDKPSLILFAKVPIAGKVKTRLQSHLSPQQCAEVAKILLEESLKKATQAWRGQVILSVAQVGDDDLSHPFIQQLQAKYDCKLTVQPDGDLGQRMAETFALMDSPCVIMGCDVPHLDSAILNKAYQSLQQGESIIGPSEDGGYYLIGLQECRRSLFEGIKWGGETVFSETLRRAKKDQLNIELLEQTYDIDQWHDLLRAAKQIPGLAEFANNHL